MKTKSIEIINPDSGASSKKVAISISNTSIVYMMSDTLRGCMEMDHWSNIDDADYDYQQMVTRISLVDGKSIYSTVPLGELMEWINEK